MRHHTTAVILLAAGLALTACSGSSHNDKPAPTTPASATATTAAKARLSTTWVPKLQAIADGPGVTACSTDPGGDECVDAVGDAVTVYGDIASAITDVNLQADYPKTGVEITKLVDAAEAYSKAQCPGDPNADVPGSPCVKNANTVTVGASTLQMVMQTDETNAGMK